MADPRRGRSARDSVAIGGKAGFSIGPDRRPRAGTGLDIEERRTRRRAGLRAVALDPASVGGGAVQYWMWNGVTALADTERLRARDVRYELTMMADHPLGRERPKTSGHKHVRPSAGRPTFPEVCQVLRGTAGFLIQDLGPGPSASFAALVTVEAGEWIALPPGLHHGTINLSGEPLVFADLIDRRATAEYEALAAARGFAHLVLVDGSTIANPVYAQVSPLERWTAAAWSPGLAGSLYERFRDERDGLAWLSRPETFATAFPGLAGHLRPVLGRADEPI